MVKIEINITTVLVGLVIVVLLLAILGYTFGGIQVTDKGLSIPVTPPSSSISTSATECENALRLLQTGIVAQVVTQSEPLLLRSGPGYSNSKIERLYPGTQVSVTEGPSCVDGHWWWKVRAPSGNLGWVVEGSDDKDPVFIQPVR